MNRYRDFCADGIARLGALCFTLGGAFRRRGFEEGVLRSAWHYKRPLRRPRALCLTLAFALLILRSPQNLRNSTSVLPHLIEHLIALAASSGNTGTGGARCSV